MMKWSLSNNKNHPWSIYPEARANNKRVHDRIVRKYKRPDNIVNFGMRYDTPDINHFLGIK